MARGRRGGGGAKKAAAAAAAAAEGLVGNAELPDAPEVEAVTSTNAGSLGDQLVQAAERRIAEKAAAMWDAAEARLRQLEVAQAEKFAQLEEDLRTCKAKNRQLEADKTQLELRVTDVQVQLENALNLNTMQAAAAAAMRLRWIPPEVGLGSPGLTPRGHPFGLMSPEQDLYGVPPLTPDRLPAIPALPIFAQASPGDGDETSTFHKPEPISLHALIQDSPASSGTGSLTLPVPIPPPIPETQEFIEAPPGLSRVEDEPDITPKAKIIDSARFLQSPCSPAVKKDPLHGTPARAQKEHLIRTPPCTPPPSRPCALGQATPMKSSPCPVPSPYITFGGGGCFFKCTLKVAHGVPFGLVFKELEEAHPREACGPLLVQGVQEGSAIEAWNRSQCQNGGTPGKAIQVGDKLWSVNDHKDAAGMLEEIKNHSLLRLAVVRGTPDCDIDSISADTAQSIRRAGAHPCPPPFTVEYFRQLAPPQLPPHYFGSPSVNRSTPERPPLPGLRAEAKAFTPTGQ